MALANNQPKKESPGIGIRKSKSLLLSGTSLASVESLSMPLVQEVVISADIRCSDCQKRVADMMSRMNGKSLINSSFNGTSSHCKLGGD
ncbi:hypothetical protein ACJW30_08G012800 [Castanea mollissima]